jgi:DNA-binding transcriptional regulator LsrR (DeoR family)
MSETTENNYDGDELLALATWMYYDDEMTHQEIADELSLSRVAVTRLLQRARQEGIVQFHITRPRPLQHELARQLMRQFDLKQAIVVKSGKTGDETGERIGRAGARHLQDVVFPHCRIGVGWSQTVSKMASYLEPRTDVESVTVNELAGSMLGLRNPYSISSDIADSFNGTLEVLPVPALVQSRSTRDALMGEARIAEVLGNGARCDIAFMGLGDVSENSTMLKTKFMAEEQMESLRQEGAVGELLLRYYTLAGEHLPTALDEQIITLEWEAIKKIPYKVVLVSGPEKVCPILGALRGQLIDCLISDTETVQEVLRLHEQQQEAAAP